MNATSKIIINNEGDVSQEIISFSNDIITFEPSQPIFLKFTSIINESHVTFHQDGKIDIVGNAEEALQYLFDTCWILLQNASGFNDQTVKIFDYLVIDFKTNTITHAGPQIPETFNEIKRVVDKVLLRKTKLKAFW